MGCLTRYAFMGAYFAVDWHGQVWALDVIAPEDPDDEIIGPFYAAARWIARHWAPEHRDAALIDIEELEEKWDSIEESTCNAEHDVTYRESQLGAWA